MKQIYLQQSLTLQSKYTAHLVSDQAHMDSPEKQGFSSEQDLNEETFRYKKTSFLDESETDTIRINALRNVQPAEEIKKKQYSLEPDMLMGWKSKIYLPKPIPLIFYDDELDYAIETLIKIKTFKIQTLESQDFVQLVYLGPRYESTYSAWFEKPFDFPYTHLNKNKRLKFTDREFVGQYWNAQTENHLHFDSFFESGNLDVAFKIGQLQYDLFMRVDSNTRGHLQWYNFKVKNMKKDHTYTFNICNFSKPKSLYSRGMKPFVLSKKLYENKKISWHQTGIDVKYQKRTPKSFKTCQLEIQEKPFRLTFGYECEFQNDEVQFAYCVPYEYSKLKEYLDGLERRYSHKEYVKISRLTHTLGGLEIPIITITSNLKERTQRQFVNKKLLVASGRIHPGQSNSSFMMEGLIEYLCQDTEECQQLRDSVVFKIIPMVNPDGVVLGNYRTSLSGKDLNREFINPDEFIFPEIYNLKKYVWKLKNLYKKDFLMYLDLHGHSTKKNCFTYGPEFSITHNNYYQCRIFPKLLSIQTQMFRYFSCIFKISQCKERTLRAVLLKYFELDAVFTVEVSNGSYYSNEAMEDVLFDADKWIQMGLNIGKSITQYVNIFKQLNKLKERKKLDRMRIKRQKQKFKVRQTYIKRQNTLYNRQEYSLSGTKSQFNKKSTHETFSISKFSPIKKKNLGHEDRQMRISKKRLDIGQNIEMQQDENMLPLHEIKDESLCKFLKQIFEKPGQDKFSGQRQCIKSSPQKYDQKSIHSDDNISQGGSDSSSSSQDLNEGFKKQLFKSIKNGSEKFQSINALSRKKHHTLTQIDPSVKTSEDQSTIVENETQFFFTDLYQSSNDIKEFKQENNMNSLKLNELRSKRQIYLKKKSHQMNLIPSPKKQTKTAPTAKIVNFEFALNPIKPTTHIWHQKQQAINTIHSLFQQNSKQKIDQKTNNMVSFAQYMKIHTQTERKDQIEQDLAHFKKRVLSVHRNSSVPAKNMQASKQANIALLRRTQERKLNINPTFYRNVKAKKQKEIEDDNIVGQRIMSANRHHRSFTEVNQT